MTDWIVGVAGALNDLRSQVVRFLQGNANHEPPKGFLATDCTIYRVDGKRSGCPQEERAFLLTARRSVEKVNLVETFNDAMIRKRVRLAF